MRQYRNLVLVDKKEYWKISIIFFLIANLIIRLKGINFTIQAFETYYLLGSCGILLLIFSKSNVDRGEIFVVGVWIFFIIAIFNVHLIILSFDVNEVQNLSGCKIDITTIWKVINIILGIEFLYDYINGKLNQKKNVFKIMFVFFLFICLSYIKLPSGGKSILIIMVSIYAIKCLKKFTYRDNQKINYLSMYLIFTIIRGILIIFVYWTAASIRVEYAFNILGFIGYGTIIYFFILNFINNPYFEDEKKLENIQEVVSELDEMLKAKQIKVIDEKRIRKSNQKMFTEFFRNIPIPIILLNEKMGISYINKTALELIGESKIIEVLGKQVTEIIKIRKEIQIKEWVGVSFEGMINSNRKVVSMEIKETIEKEFIMVLTDLTSKIEKEKLENELLEKDLQEQLKRKFLANISHDLKTPVNVIYSSVQLQDMYLKERKREDIFKYLNIADQNCLSLKRLTNNIIDIGKIDSGFLEEDTSVGNIVVFIEEIFSSLVEYAKEEGICFIFDTTGEEIYINFKEAYMERIILNLMTNAIKYNKVNGEVKVSIIEKERTVEILIKDSGIGIEKEDLDRIFERYFKNGTTITENFKSSGIGLYVVKNLVEAQGGEIKVESMVGIGTTMKMIFSKEQGDGV